MLSTIATADLRQELQRRQGLLHAMIQQRDALSAELLELESLFGAGSGGGAGGQGQRRGPGRPAGQSGRHRAGKRGPRTANPNSLVENLKRSLAGKTLSVSDVADVVRRAGYQTKSNNFRTIVNQALLGHPKVFRKVARGQYTAR